MCVEHRRQKEALSMQYREGSVVGPAGPCVLTLLATNYWCDKQVLPLPGSVSLTAR